MSPINDMKHLQIPLQDLSDATNRFSEHNLIRSGGFGKVYIGVSVKHGNIIIKMLDPWPGQGDHEFTKEIALLSVYKHENIVSLLGFCDEDGHKLLVYKYESNGSLGVHLKRTDLTWIQRLQTCLDAARGLQYLHDGAGSHHRIIHGDVKSSNIILDENWKAKITDFGLSKMDPTNTQAAFIISDSCGTIGYIDPDYMETGLVTKESDVYSFGVVLFEVLGGRLARLREYNDKDEFLTGWIKMHWERRTLDGIIYPDLMMQVHTASLLTFTAIAYQCLMSRNKRPTMKTVVEQLQKALDKQLATSDLWWNVEQSWYFLVGGRFCSFSPKWKYDVFISFRGEDTRKTFVDHLFSHLEDRQIFTYKDDEVLPRGEPIGPSLFKAIRQSRIAIIVFSKNYASSSWCLDELAYIMKNKDKRRQTVVPIFYHVEPSEPRKQTGYYGEALARHELKNRNKVKSWRKALVKAGNLSGWEPHAMANGHEAKAIRIICEDIKQKLLLKLMIHTEASAKLSANIDLIGVETHMQELKSFLKVGLGDVQMVGICGIWGSGKSTLALSVYENISHEFEGCCFVKNVRAESRMHGLKTLQEKVLSDVLKIKVKLRNIKKGTYEMKRRLSQNSVLIVLDDVDHIDHLKMLAGSKNWFGTGSRIIITTRNQHLLNAHNVITRNARLLDVQEAIELFSRHAFGESKPVQGLEDVSLMMVAKLGGHPLALISLGTFLHGKDKSEWMSLLAGLMCIPDDEILKKLETPDDGVARNIIPRFLTL
ncbi:disease resistance protein Roq1-like [Bidens hawaiensis]|uniref:disease resistance protein Roq1-like n=1 Tax=Bidens hawaiensis TaxID=980011 RepID=UPI00404B22F7